jgi:hypothetical protein
MIWFWRGGLPYDATSGVWTALADDLVHGDFYRPVQSTLGYGGTRYMPVFFSLLAGLMQLGLSAASAGLLMTLVSIMLIACAAYEAMRRFGAERGLALPILALLPASIAFQLLTISVKADLLAAALSVWGLALAVEWIAKPSARLGWLTAILFTAAILTKFTAGFALATIVLWLVRGRQWALAATLVASTVGLLIVALTLVYGLSAGRFVESFRVCATGGLNAAYAWKFPFWFVRVIAQDPFFLAIFAAAVASGFRRFRRNGGDLLSSYFVVTTLGTIALFSSPGTDSNHLIDLLVASTVLIAVELTQGGCGRGTLWTAALFAGAVVVTWLPGVPSVRHFLIEKGQPTLAAVAEIQRRLPAGGTQRLLSENPFLPIALGQRPEVMDCFSLRLLTSRDQQARADFFTKLTSRHYTAVVLIDWSGATVAGLPSALANHTSPGAGQFYGNVHFPAGFLEVLQQNYRLSFSVPPFVVFEPRSFQKLENKKPALD